MSQTILANEQIRSQRVVFIDSSGINKGEVSRAVAIHNCLQEGLDLVQVGENGSGLPVCRPADAGKMKYEQSKKLKHSNKTPSMKEMSFHLNTSEHDIQIKTRKVKEFLNKNHKVKLSVELSGREKSFKPQASEMLNKCILGITDCTYDPIRFAERSVFSVISPKNKTKQEPKNEHLSGSNSGSEGTGTSQKSD